MERKDTCDIKFYTKKLKRNIQDIIFMKNMNFDINLFAGEDEAISLT